MIYKGIKLLTTEELEYEQSLHNQNLEDYEMIPGLYFSPRNNLQNLADAISLGERGAFDFAIPQTQWEKYGDHKGLDRAIWFYPHKGETGHIFGKPLTVREMLSEYRRMVIKEMVNFFVHEYPW